MEAKFEIEDATTIIEMILDTLVCLNGVLVEGGEHDEKASNALTFCMGGLEEQNRRIQAALKELP